MNFAKFLLLPFMLCFSFAYAQDGAVSIFDGKTLEGWDGNPKFWKVVDGAITGETTKENPTKGNTFIIWRKGTLKDFELELKFKISGARGNSGIQVRSSERKKAGQWVIGGYQADFEAGNKYSGILYEERGRGILARRWQKLEIQADGKKKVTGKLRPNKEFDKNGVYKDKWNTYRIYFKGNRIQQFINGIQTVDVVDHQVGKSATEGLLALQLHAGPPMKVQFKDITLKELK